MAPGEKHQNSTSEGSTRHQFRIFLASPGDVPFERKLAREAITHISNERHFRDRLNIQIVAWDQPGAAVAMEAGLTPQAAIAQGLPKPEDCDLAVIILWSRIGTQLPKDFDMKPDGTAYLSGTEWECVNALNAFKSNGKPIVWVYRRPGAPQFAIDDPELTIKSEQWRRLQNFFAAFTNAEGVLVGGINFYETPDGFRQQFEYHLRDRLDKFLETLPIANASPSVEQQALVISSRWTETPYPGLEAFTPEQAPIYFGRGREVDQLLQQFADTQTRFVAVVGVSGSGKSSLVKAGLLPRLRSGIIGNAPWIDLIIKPGERGDNPYLALAFALKTALNLKGKTESDIANAMQADATVAQHYLTDLLAKDPQLGELLIVIDQFEELFTQCKDEYRLDFLGLLNAWVSWPRLRVIATLRADFYARAIEEPQLANLLRPTGTFPLDPPSINAIYQMIIRPAEAAGVELEEGLPQRLLDDAGNGPGSLAIIAFTLNQLYEKEQQKPQPVQTISIADYDTFGGVKGTIQTCAEAAFKGLKIDLERVLPTLFTLLVEVNEKEIATRRRAAQTQLRGDVKTLADRLITARLLVSSDDKEPMIEVAHEAVLTGWQRLDKWIHDHATALLARRDLEQAANEWDKSGYQSSALRAGSLLQRYLTAAPPRSKIADNYLTACQRRQTMSLMGYGMLGLVVISVLGIFIATSNTDYGQALATRALFVQWGLLPVTKPIMLLIPAGEFKMGDLSGKGLPNESPSHSVTLTNAFEMGQFEVTFDEYDLFAAATGRKKPSDQGWGRGDKPVINVSWDEAVAYAQWLSEQTGKKYRLPSEAEWEYAARATTVSDRYWSEETKSGKDDPACRYANVLDKGHAEKLKQAGYGVRSEPFDCDDHFMFTASVAESKSKQQLTPNPWQLFNMLGNVWEWTQDCYVDSYKDTPRNGLAQEMLGCSLRVLRGGSWNSEPQDVRSAYRDWDSPDTRLNYFGFRLARTL